MKIKKKSEIRNYINKLEKLLEKEIDTKQKNKRKIRKIRKISKIIFIIFIITFNSIIRYIQFSKIKGKYYKYEAKEIRERI